MNLEQLIPITDLRQPVNTALELLGIKNFLLGIHDAAFPSRPEEDLGRGSPYSLGAEDFLRFVRELGFTGVQLGPQGITSAANPSPYDGTLFSRHSLSLSPLRLYGPPWDLIDGARLAELAAGRPEPADRVHWQYAYRALAELTAAARLRPPPAAPGLSRRLAAFRRAQAAWLESDALYECLRQNYGYREWRQWQTTPEVALDRLLMAPPPGLADAAALRREELTNFYRREIEEYCFVQYLLHEEHRAFRGRCRELGLKLFGDCQIGFSNRDTWAAQSFILHDYLMGAPPSRTNPAGQPWNYPVLDPDRYFGEGGRPGPALLFMRRRLDKLFDEFDGLRIDHPHGLICPWVYRSESGDSVLAVQHGARLFASPNLADHPELARYAIARPDQLNPWARRHDDDWVRELTQEQIDRYGVLMAEVMAAAGRHCRGGCEVACEILSTQPYPLGRVMARYGLGRFRVTQKADLANPADVYRSENAHPEDWLMLGNHDTPPILQVAAEWLRAGKADQQAVYLADRLRIPGAERDSWLRRTAADPIALAQAKFAELFVGPGRNIMVFFTDLLGGEEAYNLPGTVTTGNWSLRVAPDYRQSYANASSRRKGLDIPAALTLALRARGLDSGHPELLRALGKED